MIFIFARLAQKLPDLASIFKLAGKSLRGLQGHIVGPEKNSTGFDKSALNSKSFVETPTALGK